MKEMKVFQRFVQTNCCDDQPALATLGGAEKYSLEAGSISGKTGQSLPVSDM